MVHSRMILSCVQRGLGALPPTRKWVVAIHKHCLQLLIASEYLPTYHHFRRSPSAELQTINTTQNCPYNFVLLDLLIRFFDHFYHDIFVPLCCLAVDMQDRSHVLNNYRRYILDGWSLSRFFFHFRQHL